MNISNNAKSIVTFNLLGLKHSETHIKTNYLFIHLTRVALKSLEIHIGNNFRLYSERMFSKSYRENSENVI